MQALRFPQAVLTATPSCAFSVVVSPGNTTSFFGVLVGYFGVENPTGLSIFVRHALEFLKCSPRVTIVKGVPIGGGSWRTSLTICWDIFFKMEMLRKGYIEKWGPKTLKVGAERIKDLLDRERGGEKAVSLCREAGVSRKTYYKWKKRLLEGWEPAPCKRDDLLEALAVERPELAAEGLVRLLKDRYGVEASRQTVNRSLAKKGLGTQKVRMDAFVRRTLEPGGRASISNLTETGRRKCFSLFPETRAYRHVEKGPGSGWVRGSLGLMEYNAKASHAKKFFRVDYAVELSSGFVVACLLPFAAKGGEKCCLALIEETTRTWPRDEGRWKADSGTSEGGTIRTFVEDAECRFHATRFGRNLKEACEKLLEAMSWQLDVSELGLHVKHWIIRHNRSEKDQGYPCFGQPPLERLQWQLGSLPLPEGFCEVRGSISSRAIEALNGVRRIRVPEPEKARYFGKGHFMGETTPDEELYPKPYVVHALFPPKQAEGTGSDNRKLLEDFLASGGEPRLRRFILVRARERDSDWISDVLCKKSALFSVVEAEEWRSTFPVALGLPLEFCHFRGDCLPEEWVRLAEARFIRVRAI